MMIVDFKREHIEEAQTLTRADYERERARATALPDAEDMLKLDEFAENGMGVAAFEEGKMAGYLCAVEPFDHVFRATDVKGVFSPMGANAAVQENRERVYAAMYACAAEKWVRAGAVSHAVCLYAHDVAAQRQLFQYGFGLRCVDSIRLMEPIVCAPQPAYTFSELPPDEFAAVYPMEVLLNRHYHKSPFFMNREMEDCDDFCKRCVNEGDRCFVARDREKVCAYLKISAQGETFITEAPRYRHITGAFCLEEYRGKGVYQSLLRYVTDVLKKEGYTRLGVDFESINPVAHRFWSKYFTAYTHGVVRRVDERILSIAVR